MQGSKRVTLGSDYPFPLGDLEIGDFITKMNLDESTVEDIFCNSTLEWLNINKEDFYEKNVKLHSYPFNVYWFFSTRLLATANKL